MYFLFQCICQKLFVKIEYNYYSFYFSKKNALISFLGFKLIIISVSVFVVGEGVLFSNKATIQIFILLTNILI